MVDILNGEQAKGASRATRDPFGSNLLHDATPGLKDPKGRLADLRRVGAIELQGQKAIDTSCSLGERRSALSQELQRTILDPTEQSVTQMDSRASQPWNVTLGPTDSMAIRRQN